MIFILIYLLILAVSNIFGIYNILEDYRLPGIGKPSDFILILLNLILFIKILIKKPNLNVVEKKFVKIIFVIFIYCIFLVFYSSVITNRESFNYALRQGASYFYFTSFLFPIFFLDNEKDLYRFINFIRIGAIITGGIAIISNIVGYSIVSGAVSHENEVQNFIRVYLPGFFNYFVIIFWTIQFITKNRDKIKIHYFEMIISSMGIILFLGRTRIVVLILMLVSVILFLGYKSANKKKIIFYVIIFSVGLVSLFGILNLNTTEILMRFEEGFSGTKQGTSTLSMRYYAVVMGYNVFTDMPVFGTGFIHYTSNFHSQLVTNTGYAITNSYDFGLPSILFTTGIIGFGLITFLIISFLKYVKQQLAKLKKTNQFDDVTIFALTIFTIVLFVYFIEQISGNEFGLRTVTYYMLSMGFAVKALSNLETE